MAPEEGGPRWDVRGYNKPGGAMWEDPFTPYSACPAPRDASQHMPARQQARDYAPHAPCRERAGRRLSISSASHRFFSSFFASWRSAPSLRLPRIAENGEPIKYQDEGYSSYSTAMIDNPSYPASRTGTPHSRSARSARADARALFKERLRQRQRALLREKEAQWDGAAYKVCPAHLVGIKPWTREPWSRDAAIYAAKTGSFERLVNADVHGTGREAVQEYNDESALDSNNGYRSTVTATGLKRNASLGGQPLWDSSTRRYCPPSIKGISPVTREPWCEDEKYYNRNSTRDTTMDERAGGGALDLGSISHATRARARQVNRSGFYMPKWEKWSAALSA